jgi:hypothetical protein
MRAGLTHPQEPRRSRMWEKQELPEVKMKPVICDRVYMKICA